MSAKSLTVNQCHHINARGRRCRMLIALDHDSLCQHHLAQSAASRPDAETVASELLDSTGELATADEVNTLLANLVRQLARKRIDRKDAMAIAYASQLLLSTLPGMDKEYAASFDSEATQEAIEGDEQSREDPPTDLLEQPPQSAPSPDEVLADETSNDYAAVRT
ncbi:MAG TPA: hypothetical protein VJW94_14505 [Candidatus Acidoferrum sp.]|nr:hypothetical protein [Candidatus Acidoferrum sp.]